jgi:hypothetical protein
VLIAYAGVVMLALLAGCAPTRIPLEATVRSTLPSASVIHVVTYPTDPPPLMTAKAMATGAMFGAFGGAVAGARAGNLGKELMEKQKAQGLSEQLVAKLSEELQPTLPNLRAAATPAEDGVAYRRLLADRTAEGAKTIIEQFRAG